MGPNHQDMERLVLIAVILMVIGLVTPIYFRIGQIYQVYGIDIAWYGQLGLAVGIFLLGILGLFILWWVGYFLIWLLYKLI